MVALVLLLWVALQFLWVARTVIIVLLIGVIIGIAMVPAVDWLEGRRVKRGLGAALVMLLVIGLIAGLIALAAPTIRRQSLELRQKLPEVMDALEKRLGPGTEIMDLLPTATKPASTPDEKASLKPADASQKPDEKEASAEQKKPGLRGKLGEQLSGVARDALSLCLGSLRGHRCPLSDHFPCDFHRQ